MNECERDDGKEGENHGKRRQERFNVKVGYEEKNETHTKTTEKEREREREREQQSPFLYPCVCVGAYVRTSESRVPRFAILYLSGRLRLIILLLLLLLLFRFALR